MSKEDLKKAYDQFLKVQKEIKKDRYLREYENFEKNGIFRIHKIDISTDYEFVEDNGDIEIVIYNNSNRVDINSRSLYFKKIDNNTCKEFITGEIFKRTNNNTFYNETTGLKFDFHESFEKAVGMDIDFVYVHNAQNYFNHYKELQEQDEIIRSKGQFLLLKKEIKFIR